MPNYENIGSPITLIAFGRSGTSLLARAFADNPLVDMVGETANLCFSIPRSLDQSSGLTRFGKTAPSQAAGDITRFAFLRLYPSQKPEWMHKPIGIPGVFWEFGPGRADEFREWYWTTLRQAFPNSRNLTVLRHPFDTYLSARRYWKFPEETIWQQIELMMRLITAGQSQFRIAVKYEDLAESPEFVFRKICTAVDLEFSDSSLGAFERLHVPDAGTMFGSSEALLERKSVGFSRHDQWSQILETDQTKAAMAAYEDALSAFGLN